MKVYLCATVLRWCVLRLLCLLYTVDFLLFHVIYILFSFLTFMLVLIKSSYNVQESIMEELDVWPAI